jgi:sortase (surface protein transpeptidase)
MKLTRRSMVGALVGGAVAAGGARGALANTTAQLPTWGDPAGVAKAGSLGVATTTGAGGVLFDPQLPVAIEIPAADVNAEIEVNKIINGQMLDPTGPWIVSWYEGTGLLGEPNRNLLMSGHVDYWGVGPAIFRSVASLSQGSEVYVYGAGGAVATYAVEYVERIQTATVTQEKLAEITGATPYEAITLITCGGEFNYDIGEYLERDIIRCRLVGADAGASEPVAEQPQEVEETPPPARPDGQPSSVTEDGVNVRSEPSTSGTPITAANTGDTVTITGDPVEADGYTWYPVTLEDGTEGWIVEDFLDIPE